MFESATISMRICFAERWRHRYRASWREVRLRLRVYRYRTSVHGAAAPGNGSFLTTPDPDARGNCQGQSGFESRRAAYAPEHLSPFRLRTVQRSTLVAGPFARRPQAG